VDIYNLEREFITLSEYINPYSNSRRWLRGNLHGHTCCGKFMDAAVSGQIYANLGYDFMAITDHNLVHDSNQWRSWQEQVGLVIIPGEENGSTDHILEIGVSAVTPTSSESYVARAKTLRDAGGFIIGCHPQEYPDRGEKNVSDAAEILHGFELFNGLREGRGFDEMANVDLWDKILTQGHKVWGVATDDFHCAHITPGHGWVCVQMPEDVPEKVPWKTIVQQLKKGAFFASTYSSFEEIILEDGILKVTTKQSREIQIIADGGQVVFQVEGTNLEWRVESNLTYFRIEALSGVKRAWSQPFFQQFIHNDAD